ncbi:hypothetical protein DW952_06120 [Ruminococcus sp. AM44-9AT]|nr:hypothetical protein DW952_06120 [Ruminococcus sp. AM44-9AT]
MRKKLLAGILALALCSANMIPQTIFAEEFTSGNPDVVSEEETPEIFTNEELEEAGETDEELSVFSSEEVPEFNDAPDEAMAAAENEQAGEIVDLADNDKVTKGVYTIKSAGNHKFICSQETGNRIVVDGGKILAGANINIYLNNVNINTFAGPALQIMGNVKAAVTIHLTGTNSLITKDNYKAGLQKDNEAQLIIKTNDSDTTAGILNARSIDGDGAGIGGGYQGSGSCSNIIIDSCSVIASSTYGAGIGGGYGYGGSCENITINGGSVKASSVSGSPKNDQDEVYCCTINNPDSLKVKVDGSPWTPVNHTNVEPNNTNLYAWLTEAEHIITVGTEERKYSFNNKQFSRIKTDPTADQFVFTQPNFTYNKDNPVDISKCIKWKDDVTGHGEITQVTYFKEDGISPINSPTDAGTYTFKINVEEGEYYSSATYISAPEWKFIISKAQAPSNKPTITTIPVSWSCKKVGDVKNCFEDDWKWNDSDISKELPVGEEVSARAVYNGTDADNYVNKSVEFKITRKACTHPHTAERYYSSPSCTSSGYSGDTYCTDCNETLSYGYTISAYGHDYDNGVITTEPTTETDGIITYTCKRCKHQDTKNLGKLGDGEPYIEGSFQKKSWDTVNDLIKTSKEKDTISIIMNGARTLPASVLSGIKGKDISLNLDMENGFIWKINGTSITAETPADTDLSVTNTAEYIPAALYSLISTNQNDFGFHLGRNGTFDFPAVLSVKADASCAGLMANLFWYDVENGVLQCIQTVTVGGAFEDSIPYADFTLSKGQDYFMAFGTESLNGRVIHTDGSITDENGAYLRPADTKISSYSIDRNKLTVKLAKGCAGAQGYDFVISRKSDMLKTGKFSKTVSSTGKPQASFRYLAKGTWYVAARSWVLDAQGNKVYGSWTKVKKIKITVVTPQQPKIRDITVKGNTVTVTYTKCKNATGYEILLGTKYKTSAGEKYPVKKYVKRTEGKNTVTVTFTNVKKGTWYVTVRSWNRTSKNKSRVYSPYSTMKKFAV